MLAARAERNCMQYSYVAVLQSNLLAAVEFFFSARIMNGRKLATSNKQLTRELAILVERKVPASNTLKKQTALELRPHQ